MRAVRRRSRSSPRVRTVALPVVAACLFVGVAGSTPPDPAASGPVRATEVGNGARPATRRGPAASTRRLLDGAYPLDAVVAFHPALFHWLDSLAGLRGVGLSGGKTIDVHRAQYRARFGALGAAERRLLQRWGERRREWVIAALEKPELWETGATPAGPLVGFYETARAEDAWARCRVLAGEVPCDELRVVYDAFAPRYASIWRDGRSPRRFLERVLADPALGGLAEELSRMASFFGVDASTGPTARLVLAPVPGGGGTHAQADGRHLLIEVRPRENLASVASVIVHENAHWMLARMDEDRRRRLEARLAEMGPKAEEAAWVLREALPTAFGQGIADRRFRPGVWTPARPWYDRDDVDRFAKRILPRLDAALAAGERFDVAFFEDVLGLYDAAAGSSQSNVSR